MAFLQMVKIAAAVELHKRAHLPYLVYLRHPTTGGVFASWGSLGHVTAAEPGALIGFLGPRVYEHLYGEPFPAGRPDRREPATPRRHRRAWSRSRCCAPRWTARSRSSPTRPGIRHRPAEPEPLPDIPAWESVEASRRPDRPGVGYLLRHGTTERVLLSGTGVGEAATTCWRWPDSAASPRWCLGQQRVVGGSGSSLVAPLLPSVSAPPHCGRPAAEWRWPPV